MKDQPVGVVTGAAQGLGFAIASELVDRGVLVVIADVQSAKALAAASELRTASIAVEGRPLDVTDSASVDKFFVKVWDSHGRLDILVNSAGIGQRLGPISTLTDDDWFRAINVNLTGTFYCCRAAAGLMQRQNRGCIVNLASINGQNAAPLAGAYNAAKAGVISLTRTLALELAPYGVRVNAVSPGPVYTAFNQSVMAQRSEALGIPADEVIENIRNSIPLGRWGEPIDIANCVSFLCSPQASWITGEVYRVSGGLIGVAGASPRPRTK